jgi:RNA polymerase sigma factor (sigma-70 family)
MGAGHVHHLLSQARSSSANEVSDRQLLLNFAGRADEAAFAAIVERHGPVVLGVCRRLLGAGPDIDDAFQATFVVLARKAASIYKQSSLGSWLYGVAHRVALQVRKQRSRRRQHETAAAASLAQTAQTESRQVNPALQASFREIGAILDQELQRLPDLERDALVVCLMEGMSHTEAAQHLGWPLGTLKTRLERGRQLLRERLQRRGLALSAVALTMVLTEQMTAAVPPALGQTALQAAAHRVCSPEVSALAGRVARGLSTSKFKLVLIGVLTMCLVGFGTALGLTGGGGEPASDPPPARQAQAQEPPWGKNNSLLPGLADVPNVPAGAIAAFGAVPFHNGARIQTSELSPDGKRLATCSRRSLTVWDLASGQRLYRFYFDVPARPVYGGTLAFSPDGKRLACRPSYDRIIILDLTTGKELRRLAFEPVLYAFAFMRFSADGSALIVQSGEDVVWLNPATGAKERVLPRVRLKQLSPDDKTFAVVEEQKRLVHLGDAKTGKITHSLAVCAKFDDMEHGVLFLPDGVTVAIVHHMDNPAKEDYRKEVQFWDLTTGQRRELTWPLPTSDRREAYRLALSADGKVLYFPEDRNNIRRLSLETGKELEPLPLYGMWTTAVFAHPDGKQLFSVHLEVIRRWDLTTGNQLSKDGDFIDWQETAISRGGHWLAMSAYQGPLELVDLESGAAKRIDYRLGTCRTLAFSPDEKVLAVNHYDHVQFLRVPELTEIKKLPRPNAALGEALIQFSADGRYFATLTSVGKLIVFDLLTDKEVQAQKEIQMALFAPDGKKILVHPRHSDVLRLVEPAGPQVYFEAKITPAPDNSGRPMRAVTALAFSPDGKVLAVALTAGEVCLLDAATGKERGRFAAVPNDGLTSNYPLHATALAFSADGQWLAVGGDDGFLRIFEVSTRRELHRLHGHEDQTQTLAFSADGRRLVSTCGRESILWNLRPGGDQKVSDPFADLLSADGPKVYRAMWTLAADPGAPALLRQHIAPVRVDARPELVDQLISDLDSTQFSVRDAAQRALAELEGSARPALLAALAKKPSLEMERRIRKLLDALDGEGSAAQLRVLRAVHVLELQGSDAARQVLRDWSEGTSGLRLTEAARAALMRLGSEPKHKGK